MNKPTKAEILRDGKDLIFITFGLSCYALGWAAFLLPYQITTGGVTGIAAIIFYATGVPIQYTYFGINAALMIGAFKILGPKFTLKTTFGIFMLTFLLGWFQQLIGNEQIIGPGQEFLACVLGASLCGLGLGFVFVNNGSTGGTDIIAAVVNKYRDVTFGRMILYCDIVIISSCYFIFQDWKRVVFGFVTLVIISYVLDLVINSARQSVQFFIFSKDYQKIADRIISDTHRGVTVLNGTGWYSKNDVKVLVVLAKKSQSVSIFRLVKDIDPNAFISQSSVIGVYGEGFDRIKVK
ncbi:YitT family protein [Bacteroides sp. OttesenSCG-928-J23]|nr:YitT family protein [Bacteroides sp. OttesenSCG-928-J23]MDL2299571.1 YitT family protein [Bacteroides sp. OttesenSCG-928-E20]MDL2305016.1 YitT family protein [Bacteroides sp. OttesenSCG-928-D19]